MSDTCRGAVERIEAAGARCRTVNDDFARTIRNPALSSTEGDETVPRASKRRDGDQASAARRDKENILKAEFVTRCDTQVDVAYANCACRGAVESLYGMRGDGT
jgi:hypothetical protein